MMQMRSVCLACLIGITVLSMAWAQPASDGYVLIKGGVLPPARVEDFEILDHPLTNAEYRSFVDATHYPSPLHWAKGKIPRGMENHPVIFVNRGDVDSYLRWISRKEGRVYRLPTTVEFEYAARGGLSDRRYPWGDETPASRANYDAEGERRYDRWHEHLRPARFGPTNGYGLYGMAGNVWQMTIRNHDPAAQRYKFRFTNPAMNESSVMGGSWARSAEYLRCGFQGGLSSGIRYPDLGFRPVREPAEADWRIEVRRLTAVPAGFGRILLSWALLGSDAQNTRFNVYRAPARDQAGTMVNPTPIGGTTWVDEPVDIGKRCHYYVRSLDMNGKEGRRSEWVGVTAAAEVSPAVATFKPLHRPGALTPMFGDLDGDGAMDCVIRLGNGNAEMSQDPGVPVQLEAFTSYGRSLWRKDLVWHSHCYGNANNVPVNVWDMDGDGKAEVITRLQIGDEVFVAILDGLSGEVKQKTPWPRMVSDFDRSSTRIHLSVAYLDGRSPAVVTQTGLYENEVFVAYDARLQKLWQYDSLAETSGSGGHKIEVADVDGDGRQEVFNGTTCLNPDGTVRWSIHRQHPDIVSIHDYLPERPGLEVFFIVESSLHAGVYMVEAQSGRVIWKVNREEDPRWTHAHSGWTADIWDGSPGLECVTNRAGHDDRNMVLFASDGRVLLEPFPAGLAPFEWDGDPTRELLWDGGKKVGDFNGDVVELRPGAKPHPYSNATVLMTADLCGDFRDELVLQVPTEEGRSAIVVVTAVEAVKAQYVTATDTLDYRLWLARNMGGGYRSIYDQPLMQPRGK